jgi:hypothetical protein
VDLGCVQAILELTGVDFAALLDDAAGFAKYAHSLGAFGKILDFVTPYHHLAVCFEEMQGSVELGRSLLENAVTRSGSREVDEKPDNR